MKYTEFKLHQQVCQYLKMRHKNALFLTDSIAAVKLTAAQAARNKTVQKDGFKCPDLLILEPRNGYNGLFLELKKESPFFKDRHELKKNAHIEAQNESINQLNERSFYCSFVWSIEMAIAVIDRYMECAPLPEPNSEQFYELFNR